MQQFQLFCIKVCGLKKLLVVTFAVRRLAGDEASFYRVDTVCEDNRVAAVAAFAASGTRGAATSVAATTAT